MADITGNAGNNILTGTDEDDVIAGLGGNDTLSGGKGNDFLFGQADDDALNGGAGGDFLFGGLGNDKMTGGAGDDTYEVESAGDKVTEAANAGIDTVFSSVASFTLGANIENLTLNGGIEGTGNSLNNVITGNGADNKLNGGAGNDTLNGTNGVDTLTGGAGNDIYIVDGSDDQVIEAAGGGIDEVRAVGFSINIDGNNNIENLTLLGGSDDNAFGNDTANKITGGSGVNLLGGGAGNDTLDGGDGGDRLIGGFGNDIFIVDSGDDLVEESKGQGTDTVLTSDDFTLADGQEIEKLTLTGSAGIGVGNEFANIITGNSGGDLLDGGKGNDTLADGDGNDILIGGAGNDTMTGGKGNDSYDVDSVGDKLTEAANQGRDTVFSRLANFTLGANFEVLDLDDGAINGTGNSLDNTLDGNNLDNKLDGGGGNDILFGANSNDTLIGGAGNDSLQGDAGLDVLDGGGGDDVLIDAFGGDTMKGGTGNDNYTVLGTNSNIVELANGGVDEVFAVETSFSLAALGNVENLTLVGTSSVGTGNDLSNRITGSSEINQLEGGKGNDTLDGGEGGDALIGGLGNDTYIVDDLGDGVFEDKGQGTDTVRASVSFNLAGDPEIENLTLVGDADRSGTGNALNNVITGNGGNNNLEGGGGNDTIVSGDGDDFLDGGSDNDSLTGGKGNDVYFIDSVGDKLKEAANQGQDLVISFLANFTLGANFENLSLAEGDSDLNGIGNSLNNRLFGNDGDNRLDGGAGNDIIDDGAGNDTLIGGTGHDELSSTDGLDVLDGGVGNDTLRDIDGGDTLKGGVGNDLYIVRTANSTIVEAANGGIDTVEALDINFSIETLATIENLELVGNNTIGTGNKLANKITGSSGFNFLLGVDGNDTLDGGDGPDQMNGGFGNDTFLVNDAGDVVLDGTGQGRDTILASTDYTITGGQEIEALTLIGSEGLSATGNTFANTLTGNGGDNVLRGGGGGDVLAGGKGGDLYFIEDVRDKVIEAAGAGGDTVGSALTSYTLTANVEGLFLLDAALNGTGNGLANQIIGNALGNRLDGVAGNDEIFGNGGNDILIGGLGNDDLDGEDGDDTLLGGSGNDILEGGDGADILNGDAGKDVFFYELGDSADLATLGGDTISGFAKGVDKIDLRDLLDDFGIDSANAIGGGFLQLLNNNGNTIVRFDSTGGADSFATLAFVTNAIVAESDLVL